MLQAAIVEGAEALRTGRGRQLAEAGIPLAGSFATVDEALAAFARAAPGLVLIDLEAAAIPGKTGAEGIRRIRFEHPDTRVLVLVDDAEDARLFEAICAGACGFVRKTAAPERLIEAIRELASSGPSMAPEIARQAVAVFARMPVPERVQHRLTARERHLLDLLAHGHPLKHAAKELRIAIDTVRFHLGQVYGKLHFHGGSDAMRQAVRRGRGRGR